MSSIYALGAERWAVSNGLAQSLDEGWARWLQRRGADEVPEGAALVELLERTAEWSLTGMLGFDLTDGIFASRAVRRLLLMAVEDLAHEHVRAMRGTDAHESLSFLRAQDVWDQGFCIATDEAIHRMLRASLDDAPGPLVLELTEDLRAATRAAHLGVRLARLERAPDRVSQRPEELALRRERVDVAAQCSARDTFVLSDLYTIADLEEADGDPACVATTLRAAEHEHDPENRRIAIAIAHARATRFPHAGHDPALADEVWLLPGMDGTGRLFGPLRAALRADLRVRVMAYDAMHATYDELLAALPVPRSPVVVVAESFGGPLAVRLARRGGVSHLVLVASFVRAPWARGLGLASYALGLLPRPPSLAVRLAMVGPGASATLVEDFHAAVGSVPRSTLAARVQSLARVDVRAELAALELPVTAIVASRDRLVPRSRAEEPGRIARRGEVVVLDGPHLLAQAEPAQVARVIERICAR